MDGERAAPVSCLVCRKRKVKCDRTRSGCHKCRKFGAQCVYSADAGPGVAQEPSDSVTQAGFERRRMLRSCIECRRAKAKCSGGSICGRCIKGKLVCHYHSPEPRQSVPTWLTAATLPPIERVRELVDVYFARIHPVRCLGFLHVPTFMERLKNPGQIYGDNSGLIYVVCALAAPFHYAETSQVKGEQSMPSSNRYLDAGKGWATTAMQSVFSNLGTPEIECLMTEVLLHEYWLRSGDYAKGFLLSGLISRHIQVLQLNLEHDYDILCQRSSVTWAVKESRRRLLWSCYLLDAFIECGIEQLQFISPDDIQVQLPCSEDLFIRNKPCVTEILESGRLLPFVRQPLDHFVAENLDMRAFYVRAMAIRSKVLKYVKHLDGEIPWHQDSRFTQLNRELQALETSIPDTFQMSPENTYLFKTSGRLSLYFGLHILISQTYNDLYRVGVSFLVYPNTATQWIRENAPRDFIETCHRTCASKATYIATLLDDLWQCHKPSLVDVPYAMHTQICSSVLVTTLASWQDSDLLVLNPAFSREQYRAILQKNITILQYLRQFIKADLYYESAIQALKRFDELFPPEEETNHPGQQSTPSSLSTTTSSSESPPPPPPLPAPNPPQYSLEYILNPLGVYPMARKQARDRHEPQSTSTSGSGSGNADHHHPPVIESFSSSDNTSDHAHAHAIPGTGNNNEFHASEYPTTTSNTGVNVGALFDASWDCWDSELQNMDNMGYPTFLIAEPNLATNS